VASGVGDETPIHRIRDASLQRSDSFLVRLAFVESLVVVDPSWRVVADLGDGGGVDRVVQRAVPASRQAMADVAARRHLDGCGGYPLEVWRLPL
jgi:hypothetical protein